jgi:hypothetical protein
MTPDEVARVRAASDNAWMDALHPETWLTPRMKLIGVLWKHQGAVCAICAKPMAARCRMKSSNRLSVDHVFPLDRRHLRSGTFRRIFFMSEKAARRGGFNYVCAHAKCNSEKGNRHPTGCELIWLQAVNARRGYDPLGWKPRSAAPGRTLQRSFQPHPPNPALRNELIAEGLIR